MELSKQLFQKNLSDVTYEDVVDFFKFERQETAVLEFKSGRAEVEKITQEVCAFLNTDGGLIIYGAPEETKIQSGNRYFGELTPTNKVNNKVSLGSSIASNISPFPVGINIHQIDVKGRFIFIIEVPKSNYSPHQVSNQGKYFIRMDTEARPAPHGFVEAMFFKRQKPNLDLNIKVDYSKSTFIDVEFSLSNDNEFTAQNIGFIFDVYGIESIVPVDLLYEKGIIHKDYILKYYTPSIDTILVKGIDFKTILSCIPCTLNKIVVHCIIWCKDITARKYYFVFDPLNYGQPEEVYYSELDSELPALGELLKPYHDFVARKNQ